MRSIPAATRQNIESEESASEYIVLLELRHPSIGSDVIRLANALTDIVSNGNTYVGFPFTLSMPDAPTNQKGQVSVQNVDKSIGQFLLSLRSPPEVDLIVIVSTDPDVELIHARKLWLRNIQGDQLQVSGDLDIWDLATEPWPARRIEASTYPAVFWL